MTDNKYVKKVMTFKSGPFYFTALYNKFQFLTTALEESFLYAAIVDLPILPDAAAKLEEEVIIKSIFGTAAIEGNPLTEEKVAQILSAPEGKAEVQRAEKEILNLKSAYLFIKNQRPVNEKYALTEDVIRKLHRIITEGIDYKDNTPGAYRNEPVKVGDEAHGGVYVPPKIHADIKSLMKEFCDWMNSKDIIDLPPQVRACLAHYHLAIIHPFGNGNGRTARALEGLLLSAGGVRYLPVILSNYYYRNIDDYYWAFTKTLKHPQHEITPFLEFTFKGMIESLKDIKDKINTAIRRLTLRQHCDDLRKKKQLTQRQHDLLLLLLENDHTFTLGDLAMKDPFVMLYRKVSERTARRDLKKLEEMKLLTDGNGPYKLNLRVLG